MHLLKRDWKNIFDIRMKDIDVQSVEEEFTGITTNAAVVARRLKNRIRKMA
jgi:hypothetical protein